MSDARFDISFDGTLKAEADPTKTREQLRALFKLDEQGVERLFRGKPVLIKRGVDGATAARYKRAFDEVGAIIRVTLVEDGVSGQTETDAANDPRPLTPEEASGLSLAPMGDFLEEAPEVKMIELDISHLSLVPGPEWTLADCEPDPPHLDPPDTSYLTLADMDVPPDDNQTR
ncbi:hypothetical protein [Thiocystis violacea]|uniref:hypothetical protein n=1 Tax=Thiocystis violacea TaxID=13725 RepID=UPI0019066D43|nr:hypothetical protein [Thiocystis violacea]MBK1722246.1 hypothetical protein [Thiocystis violacea]